MLQYIFFPDTVQEPQVLLIDYALIMLAMICLTAILVAAAWPSGNRGTYSLYSFIPPRRPRPAPPPENPLQGMKPGYYYIDAYGRVYPVPAAQQFQPQQTQMPQDKPLWRRFVSSSSASKKSRRKMSQGKRFRILRRDGFRCQLCGRQASDDEGITLHIDHKLPLAKGGTNDDGNLWVLCNECNGGKSDAVIDEILEDSAAADKSE